MFNVPLTAHFLGGAVIGDSPATGVIDPYHRVYGYPSLYVVDGARSRPTSGSIPRCPSRPRLNERRLWPNKGEQDQRPDQGQPYQPMSPIAPKRPVVPANAPGGLRNLPISRSVRDSDLVGRRGRLATLRDPPLDCAGATVHHPAPCWWWISAPSTRS